MLLRMITSTSMLGLLLLESEAYAATCGNGVFESGETCEDGIPLMVMGAMIPVQLKVVGTVQKRCSSWISLKTILKMVMVRQIGC